MLRLLTEVMPWVPARLAKGLISSTRNRACSYLFLPMFASSTVPLRLNAPLLCKGTVPAVVRYRLSGDSLAAESYSFPRFLVLLILIARSFLRLCLETPGTSNSFSTARLMIPPSSLTSWRGDIGRIFSRSPVTLAVVAVLSLRSYCGNDCLTTAGLSGSIIAEAVSATVSTTAVEDWGGATLIYCVFRTYSC